MGRLCCTLHFNGSSDGRNTHTGSIGCHVRCVLLPSDWHDYLDAKMIFHRISSALVCIAIFFLLMWFATAKLVLFHYPRFWITSHIFQKRFREARTQSRRFIYHYAKALDQAACAGAFGGLSDETISNRAGRIFKERGWHSPWWVVVTKKLTERWEENHLESSIEPLRPDPMEEK